jgi:isoleucyl-tRNA synthetase
VIFLATAQWFIAMDASDLRARALDAVSKVQWVPAWGEERIRGMVASRPDWCISRQRSWGVPIPAVDCAACHEAILTTPLIERASAVFAEHGADSWYEHPVEEFIPPGLVCPSCGGRSFERERDILDVWFDSGSSHEAVMGRNPDLRWPADVYLEGSDQYRGWFQSSLLIGVVTRGTAPYRTVVTHGMVVDEQGRKMSKSLGNAIEPEEVIAKSGAEVFRLWSAMTDFRDELRFGPEILARVVEAYRKIRNTCRILVANLYDFDPATDLVPLERMAELDRYALARYGEAALRILRAYEQYDFPVFFQALNQLTTIDLSAFYIDVSKDRLYTLAPRSEARRSAQTALYLIADGLTRLIAPVLPVSADELWLHLPGRRDPSVHLAGFPAGLEALVDEDLVARWARLIRVRDEVNAEIEKLRQQKVVGTSLAAKVRIRATGAVADLLECYRDELPTLFITSQVSLERVGDLDDADAGRAEGVRYVEGDGAAADIVASRADGVRCDRCWRYVPAVSSEPARRGVCDRCVDALERASA